MSADPQEALEIRRRVVIKAYGEALARSGLDLAVPGPAKTVYDAIREAAVVATQDRVHRERHAAYLDGLWTMLSAIESTTLQQAWVSKALTVLIIHTHTTLECEKIDNLATVETFVLPGLTKLLGGPSEA